MTQHHAHSHGTPHAHHGHSHGHAGAAHAHAHGHFDRAFAIGIVLNLVFVGIEAYWGWQAQSMALLADAGHNLSDVGGLILAWAATWVGRLPASAQQTYGWKRASIAAALINGALLLMAVGILAWESWQRFQQPQAPAGAVMMVVAGVGVFINAATAWLFMRGSHHDLNLRGAFLHMAADALVSVGVVVAGALSLWGQWTWIDPAVALLIVLVILWGAWGLFWQSVGLMFDRVPHHIDWHDVRQALLELDHVQNVGDLHIWALGTSDVALTVHLAMPDHTPDDAFYEQTAELLAERFGIHHVTLQVTRALNGRGCDHHLSSKPAS